MKQAPLQLKHSPAYCRQSAFYCYRSSVSQENCTNVAKNTPCFSKSATLYQKEQGFLLIFLLPILFLIFISLSGSIKLIDLMQRKIATQAQLDICATEIAISREILFIKLSRLNQALEITKFGIYAARGAIALGPAVGAVGVPDKLGLASGA